MSASWSEGYFTDDVYTYGYYRELSPVFLRFCLLMQRIMPPPVEETSYCELGFGQGLSLNIHAASIPGTFTGTDFNPEQVAFASRLASAAGSSLSVSSDSFEDYLTRDLPQFDFITLHGIWSWITPDNRAHIVDFVRKHLKVGGAFYISYNCNPGWAAPSPLRQAFSLHDKLCTHGQSTEDRVQQALAFTERLLAAKPNYMLSAPGLETRLEGLKKQAVHYLSGEYLNEHWDLMYFTDVVNLLMDAKLDFAAPASPLDTIQGLGMTAEAQAFLATLENPIMREQMRDYFVNRQFRKDIFLCGGTKLTPVEQQTILLRERFVLLQQPGNVKLELTAGMGTVGLKPEIYQPVLEALAHNSFAPKSLHELVVTLASQKLNYTQIVSAVTVLVGAGVASPCQSPAAAQRGKKTTAACNAALCRLAHTRSDVGVLASPLIGGAVPVSRVEQLFVAAQGQKEAVPAHVWHILQANGEKIVKDGTTLENDADSIDFVHSAYTRFCEQSLPILKALGVA